MSARPTQPAAPRAWQLEVTPPASGPRNMALDHAMLESAAAGYRLLRLYQWDPPCLSLGRNEPATARYDRPRIAANGIDVVRRPTGGRAVWHERELTYAIAMPAPAGAGIDAVVRDVHAIFLEALRRLGVEAAQAPFTALAPLDSGPCFSLPARGELLVGGRKVLGSAQVREGGGLLQHGSLLLDGNQDAVTRFATGTVANPEITTLSAAAGRAVGFSEAADAVIAAFTSCWGAPAGNEIWPSIAARADALEPRYRSADWTWRR